MTPVAVVLLAIGAVFTLLSSITTGVLLFRIEARAARERGRDATLVQLAGDVRSLKEGMSDGAQRAFATLAGRLDTVEDDAEQTREKVTVARERISALERTVEGHIRTPGSTAHPAAWGPSPA